MLLSTRQRLKARGRGPHRRFGSFGDHAKEQMRSGPTGGTVLAWVDDRLVDAAQAVVSVYDRGFRSGEGVFETFRSYGTHPFRLAAHLDRAAAGASVLGFPLPRREVLTEALLRTAEANSDGDDLVLRLTVTAGRIDPDSPFPGRPVGSPTTVVTAHPLLVPPETYERGVRAVLVTRTREVPDVKAVSYLAASLARQEARARGADEALLLGADGTILEGSYSNVFAVTTAGLITPPLRAGILPGVTRAVVIELAERAGMHVHHRPLRPDDLVGADEAFLTATTRELVPLVAVGSDLVGGGQPGEVTRSLHADYRDEVSREIRSAAGGR
jgi:branched-chain amino acid aminotransferase